ncbi:MAG: preprotein translocase subunit YajC [Muribaculaceae bacterium]|nr:preprotein translocase subunit YajC [Muribaculaceae bacterium]
MILLQAGSAEGAGAMNIIMIVLIIGIFYFFMIRPQQKKQKEIRKFREGIQVGNTVVTAGGIYGKVRKIKEDIIVLEISNNVTIDIDKNSVYPSAAREQNEQNNRIEESK